MSEYQSCPHMVPEVIAGAINKVTVGIKSIQHNEHFPQYTCTLCDMTGKRNDERFRSHAIQCRHYVCVRCRDPTELYCFACNDFQFSYTFDRFNKRKRPPAGLHLVRKGMHGELSVRSSSGSYKRVKGFCNMGATCFMSSVLQVLFKNSALMGCSQMGSGVYTCVSSLVQKSSADSHTRLSTAAGGGDGSDGVHTGCASATSTSSGPCIYCEFVKLNAEAKRGGNPNILIPSNLLYAVWNEMDYMAGYHQQDAHEFLVALLDGLDQHFRQNHRKENLPQAVVNSLLHQRPPLPPPPRIEENEPLVVILPDETSTSDYSVTSNNNGAKSSACTLQQPSSEQQMPPPLSMHTAANTNAIPAAAAAAATATVAALPTPPAAAPVVKPPLSRDANNAIIGANINDNNNGSSSNWRVLRFANGDFTPSSSPRSLALPSTSAAAASTNPTVVATTMAGAAGDKNKYRIQVDEMMEVFRGSLDSHLTCKVCGHSSVKSESFLDLSLSLQQPHISSTSSSLLEVSQSASSSQKHNVDSSTTNAVHDDDHSVAMFEDHANESHDAVSSSREASSPSSNDQSDLSLSDCLHYFTTLENLGEKVYCEVCGKSQEYQKQLVISTTPNVLILHLKRFDVYNNKKISTGVKIQLKDWDIAEFTHKSTSSIPDSNNNVRTSDEPDVAPMHKYAENSNNGNSDKFKMRRTETNGSNKDTLYNLQGVVCHSGTLHGGHYISYIIDYASNDQGAIDLEKYQWLKCDDETITVVTEDEVKHAEAYILFYVKDAFVSLSKY